MDLRRRWIWISACAAFLGLCALATQAELALAKLDTTEVVGPLRTAAAAEPADQPDKLPDGAILRIGSVRMSHPGGVLGLRFHPNGKEIITLGFDDTIRLWDMKTGAQAKVVGKPREEPPEVGFGNPSSFAVSADGKFAIVGNSQRGQAKVWNLDKGEVLGTFGDEELEEGQFGFFGVGSAVSPDGSRVAVGELSGKLKLFDAANKKELKSIAAHKQGVTAVTFAADGKSLVTGGGDMKVLLWTDLDKEKPASVQIGMHRDGVRSVAITADGKRVVSSGADGFIRVWDVTERKQLRRFELARTFGQRAQASTVQISADGKTVAGCGILTAGFTVWDVETGKVVFRQSFDQSQVQLVPQVSQSYAGMSPDGTFAAVAMPNGRIELTDIKNGKKLNAVEGHDGDVTVVAVSPDGRIIATGGSDATIRLWNMADGKQAHLLDSHLGPIGFLQFSEDGQRLFSASSDFNDKVVSVWDVKTGKEIDMIEGRIGFAGFGVSLAISADGKFLATIGQDQKLSVREIATRKEVLKKDVRALSLDFTADGKSVIVSTFDPEGMSGMSRINIADGNETALPKLKLEQSFFIGLSPDGQYAILRGFEGGSKLMHMVTGKLVRQLSERESNAGGRAAGRDLYDFSRDTRALAMPGKGNAAVVLEMATGKERLKLQGHQAPVISTCFTAEGAKLVTASKDQTVLVWDLTRVGKEKPAVLKPDELWKVLAAEDADKAYFGMLQLMATPKEAAAFIKERLKAMVVIDRKRIEQFVAELDSEDFEVRKKAVAELEKLGEIAEPYLQKAIESKPPLEVKQRMEDLVGKIQGGALTTEQIRGSRCIEVLEKLGTAEAREVLEQFAKGEPGDKFTKWSKESLARMGKRSK